MTSERSNAILQHFGVKGMKWGVRKKQLTKPLDDNDLVIKKGTDIHRVMPKEWVERERNLSGHAYASYKKEDVEQYKRLSKLLGGKSKYVDMRFKVTKDMVSPSTKKRVDAFIKLMDSDPKARDAMIKATRNPLIFMPKKHLDKLDDPKTADKAFRKFSFLLVSKKDLRDPYFKELEKKGYSMILDDADIKGGISKSPIIVFDRSKTLKYDSEELIQKGVIDNVTSEDFLKHFGVKGMKWGVRRTSGKTGSKPTKAKDTTKPKKDLPSPLSPSRIKKEVKSMARELHWMKYSVSMNKMNARQIGKISSRIHLENELKKLTKESRKTAFNRLTPIGRQIRKKERADYLRRGDMSNDELSRKVNLLRAKASLRRGISKASEEQIEFGRRVVNVSAQLAVKKATGQSIGKRDIAKAVVKSKNKNIVKDIAKDQVKLKFSKPKSN